MSVNPKPYTGNYPISLNFHFKLHGKPLDISNHFYLTKLVEDGLVACGVIPDDSQKYIKNISVSSEKSKKDEDDVVEVELSPTI